MPYPIKGFAKVKEAREDRLPRITSSWDLMNQAGQLQLCAVMLAEARLVGRKVGEDVFVEAGVTFFSFFCILEVKLRREMGR